MIKKFNWNKQQMIAWCLFIILYSEMFCAAYAGIKPVYNFSNNLPETNAPLKGMKKIPDPITASALEIKKSKPGNNAENNFKTAKLQVEEGNVGGPGQPEMATFKSVGADNMVNLFTGDFSYNIPLLDVDGYPVNIFYNGAPSMDQESSWVGLGWNINPGVINRNMRGIPDDFNGDDKIVKVQSMKPEITVGVKGSKTKEIIGLPVDKIEDKGKWKPFNYGVFYNSRRGIGFEIGKSFDFFAHQKIAAEVGDEKTYRDTTAKVALSNFDISADVNLNSQTGLTPKISFTKFLMKNDYVSQYSQSTSIDFNSRTGLGDLRLDGELTTFKNSLRHILEDRSETATGSLYSSSISFARTSYTPTIRMPVTNFNATFSLQLGRVSNGKAKNTAITGYYTQNSIRDEYRIQSKSAYGFMYYEKGNDNKNALLDFNRSNDGSVTYKTPILSIPVYTYDVFSISGEGTGGTFRGYRGNMGYTRDPYTRTNPGKVNIDLEFDAKNKLKVGSKIGGVYSATTVGGWETENALKQNAAFRASEKMDQRGFYFKNPGERAIIDEDYYNTMGQDKLMRPMMNTGLGLTDAPPFFAPTLTLQSKFQLFNESREFDGTTNIHGDNSYRKKRDKRTQVISYLTAEEADHVALDRNIYSYAYNSFKPGTCYLDPAYKTKLPRRSSLNSDESYRRANHLSEITVQEGDKRYVYGIPVYQLLQKEVVFSTGQTTPDARGLVDYKVDNENSPENSSGKDGFFQSETIDPYAHSFLLSAILSGDYSDLTGDGISDDDLGTAIKFNYTRVAASSNGQPPLKWRLPVERGKANFNRGLVTSNEVTKDNKASYTYGKKELWYTHSIESKNMIATFTLSNRKDGWGVQDENGGLDNSSTAACQKKLDKIDLYSKADFVKYGSKAKPVKTVHFVYSYELCKNYNLNDGTAIDEDGNNPAISGKPNINANAGKLTLKSIYFTYNNNNHQKNRYRFNYKGTDVAYNSLNNDRWGNYKPASQNSGNGNLISNEDYPYAVQDKAMADANAAVFSLSQVLLPSGAKIDVTYEADDYAYVQNRRAAQMSAILGFGMGPGSNPEPYIYTNSVNKAPWDFKNMDYRYVFFNAPVKVHNKAEIAQLYLKDMSQLLLKLWVKIPKDAYEPMFVYCDIDDFDVVAKSDNNNDGAFTRFYVKVGKASGNSGSQIMETVLQYFRDQLPAKAFPGYDVSDKTGAGQVVKALFGMVNNIRTGLLGFENNVRWDGVCRGVELVRSVARLSNPYYKKEGGGYRVKKVTITDNFKKMLKSTAEIASVYGQEYDYTTTEMVNNQPVTISSGVASYEPGIGNEENPFREIYEYSNKSPLGPTANSSIELPIAETYFPTPFIGYSRVTVKSIHNKANNENLKSGVGMQETQFYTTKDFPVRTDYTDFDMHSRHHYKPLPINKIMSFGQKDYMSFSQGFRIILNDMNGKEKMQASYAENDLKNPITKTTYFYRMKTTGDNKYQLDNVLPVVTGPNGEITNKLVGKDIEVMNDFREHFSFTHSAQIPINVDFFNAGSLPIIIPTIFRSVFRNESLFRSATTLKVVNEFGIMDSVEVYDKGSIVSTKNLLYDAETGDVLVSRTQNEFNKPVYNFSYPAYWAYEAMGPAYKNIDATYKDILFRNGKIEGGLTPAELNSIFESGDEIYVMDKASLGPVDNPGCIANGSGNPCTRLPKSDEYRIWALDITKDTRNTTKDFIFIDRYGNPYNAADADIRIIRSGRRNLTSASVGSVTSMASPIALKADNKTFDKLLINDNTNVLNSGAVEFKEKWKTQDAFYVKESIVNTTLYAPVITKYFYPVNDHVIKKITDKNTYVSSYLHEDNRSYFVSSQTSDEISPHDYSTHYQTKTRSWMKFELFGTDGIPQGSTCIDADLFLVAHGSSPSHTENIFHDASSAHLLQGPSVANDIVIGRLMKKWEQLGPKGSLGEEDVQFSGTSPYVVHFAPGFPSGIQLGTPPPYVSSQSYHVPVKELVAQMINDYYDNSKSFDPAFSINHQTKIPEGNDNSRFCFGTWGNVPPPSPGDDLLRTLLKVKYYDCSHAAVSPPPTEYVTCGNGTTTVKVCTSIFSKDYINPYVQGLLGNWRPVKSYAYYGERREQDPAAATTINKNGYIKNFETFWSFDNNNQLLSRTNPSTTVWKWNAAITQYNRKGAELENYNPMGIYSCGIYGYNEALPVAVVNNSRLRTSAFDGFEDYFFKDQSCDLICNPNKRHFNTQINTTLLDETQAHTGRYSFKTPAGNTSSIKINISGDSPTDDPDLLIHQNKTTVNITSVQLAGNGLYGIYSFCNAHFNSCDNEPIEHDMVNLNNSVPPGIQTDKREHMRVLWKGKLQVAESGQYDFNFLGNLDDKGDIWIDLGSGGQKVHDQVYADIISHTPVTLVAGQSYNISVGLWQTVGGFSINLAWKKSCEIVSSLVPRENLYMDSEPVGQIATIPVTCTKVDDIKAKSNYLIDEFRLIPGQKMLASVWVKKGISDCRCAQYAGINLKLKDQNGNVLPGTDGSFMPKGNIIEGWQQMEAVFTVPEGKELSMVIDNSANSNDAVYIDDLRFHPYNANMKSFVYNPYNLKPAAELDENNYATFYEYDDDGTLIRVKKETKQGIKTIQESRSGLQKTINDF